MSKNGSKSSVDVGSSCTNMTNSVEKEHGETLSSEPCDEKKFPDPQGVDRKYPIDLKRADKYIFRLGVVDEKGINLWESAEYELYGASLPGLIVFDKIENALSHDRCDSNGSRILCAQLKSSLPSGWRLNRIDGDLFLCPPKSEKINNDFIQKTFQKQEWQDWTAVGGYRIFNKSVGLYFGGMEKLMDDFDVNEPLLCWLGCTFATLGKDLERKFFKSIEKFLAEPSSPISAPMKSYDMKNVDMGNDPVQRYLCMRVWSQYQGLKFVLENFEKMDEGLDNSILNGFRWNLVLMSKVMENVVNGKLLCEGLAFDPAYSPYVYCANKLIVEYKGDEIYHFDVHSFPYATWHLGQNLWYSLSELLEKNGYEKVIDLDDC